MEGNKLHYKRVRSNNFSKEEELLLLEEVEKFKEILECKATDKFTTNEKNEAWKKILLAYNARNQQTRTLMQIKSKFDNLKTKARKAMVENQRHLSETGGEPAQSDPIIEAMLQILNNKTELGFENPFDSDLCTASTSQDFLSVFKEEIIDIEENKPTMDLDDAVVLDFAIDNEEESPKIEKHTCSSDDTPQKVRQPMSNSANIAKEAYYMKKTELLEQDLRKRKREEEEFEREVARKEEVHAKKIKLLDLEIEKKKK